MGQAHLDLGVPADGFGGFLPALAGLVEPVLVQAAQPVPGLLGRPLAFPGDDARGLPLTVQLLVVALAAGDLDPGLLQFALLAAYVGVGGAQPAPYLRSGERGVGKDRTNVRELTLEAIDGEAVDLVVGDLSFIPLGLVLPALARCAAPDADLVLMVKPQFEVGKERLGSGGVVRSPELRAEAVREVARRAWGLGLGVQGVTASPLPGPSGNVEYFLWLRAGAPELDPADVDRAVAEGPR